jgi:hypothetical protein
LTSPQLARVHSSHRLLQPNFVWQVVVPGKPLHTQLCDSSHYRVPPCTGWYACPRLCFLLIVEQQHLEQQEGMLGPPRCRDKARAAGITPVREPAKQLSPLHFGRQHPQRDPPRCRGNTRAAGNGPAKQLSPQHCGHQHPQRDAGTATLP